MSSKLTAKINQQLIFYVVIMCVKYVIQEWVPIIRHDMLTQRKMKAQPPLSDAYLHGMPAKRRKVCAPSTFT